MILFFFWYFLVPGACPLRSLPLWLPHCVRQGLLLLTRPSYSTFVTSTNRLRYPYILKHFGFRDKIDSFLRDVNDEILFDCTRPDKERKPFDSLLKKFISNETTSYSQYYGQRKIRFSILLNKYRHGASVRVPFCPLIDECHLLRHHLGNEHGYKRTALVRKKRILPDDDSSSRLNGKYPLIMAQDLDMSKRGRSYFFARKWFQMNARYNTVGIVCVCVCAFVPDILKDGKERVWDAAFWTRAMFRDRTKSSFKLTPLGSRRLLLKEWGGLLLIFFWGGGW